jgi:hypothetical protein
MPGINQLGGALTAIPAPNQANSKDDNQAANPQAQAGLQVAGGDAVRGVTKVKPTGNEEAGGQQRNFSELARGRSESTDPKTGDVIKVGQDIDEEAVKKAFGRDDRTSSQAKQRLKRSLNDLFAPRPQAPAQAAAPEAEAEPMPEPREEPAESLDE